MHYKVIYYLREDIHPPTQTYKWGRSFICDERDPQGYMWKPC